jgi:hypothetical protein
MDALGERGFCSSYTLLTLALNGCEVSVSGPSPDSALPLEKRSQLPFEQEVGCAAEEKFSTVIRNQIPVFESVVRHFTD